MRLVLACCILIASTALAAAQSLPDLLWPANPSGSSQPAYEESSKILTTTVVGPPTNAESNSKVLTAVVVDTQPPSGAPMRMPMTHW